MKNNMKKLLSLVLTLVMVLSLVPAMSLTASAANPIEIADFYAGQTLELGTTISKAKALNDMIAGLYVYVSKDKYDELSGVEGKWGTDILLVTYSSDDTTTLVNPLVSEYGGSFNIPYGLTIGRLVDNHYWVAYPSPPPGFDVTINPGAYMTPNTTQTQSAVSGSMSQVTFTAQDGYYFPSNYTATNNGVTATRDSDSQITVSGTPTGTVDLVLPGATQIKRNVTVSLGTGMQLSSGTLTQNNLTGAMSSVVITAATGYSFPLNYAATNSGVSVTRDSATQITVSGTPTCGPDGRVTLTLPAATPNTYTLTITKNDKISGVTVTNGTPNSVDANGIGTYTVTYNTNFTVSATPVANIGSNEYSFYRWVSGATTMSNSASYTYQWTSSPSDMTLRAEGVGGLVAVGTISVAPANLEADKTATVTLSDSGTHSVSLVSGSTTILLTKGASGYTTALPAADTTAYEIWVDGIKTSKTVKGGNTTSITMTTFDCTVKIDGVEDPSGDHVVVLKRDGVTYPAGSVLPADVNPGYERWVDGVKYDMLTGDVDTNFYTVKFINDATGTSAAYPAGTPWATQVVLHGGKAVMPTAKPIKGGFTFLGWNATGDEADELFNFTTGSISAATALKAVWKDNTACEARWVIDGETFYGTLTEALAAAVNDGDHIYVQKSCTLAARGTLKEGVTLEMDAPSGRVPITIGGQDIINNGTIINTGKFTNVVNNSGTITNVVADGITGSGSLSGVRNSGVITGGTMTQLENTGTVKNATITTVTRNSGTLDGCRIEHGTGIGGTITGSTYAGDGVTFAVNTTFSAATVSIQGGGTVNADLNNVNAAANFAGIVAKREVEGKTYIKPMANLILRAPITFASGANLELDGKSIVGANGGDSPTAPGVTPIQVNDGVLDVTGPGSIIGGNGGDGDNSDGGDGGNGIDASDGGSVEIGEEVIVSGGDGGTGDGPDNHGGKGGDGIKGSANNDDYIRVDGTAEGGNGGPAINDADGGSGGNGVNAAIIYDGGGDLTGGQPGDGRFGDPLDDATGGTDGTVEGEPRSAEYTWIVDFTTSRMTATNSSHPNNQITPATTAGTYTSTLAITPVGNRYISIPETITVKMGNRTLTAGEGKDYTYDKDTGVFVLLLGSEGVTANISITANGVVPNEVDVTAADELEDALEAEIKKINVKDTITLSGSNTVPENSVVYVDAEKTLTVAGGQALTVEGAVVVNGTLSGTATPTGTGSVLETPTGVWSDASNSDFITGLKPNTTYKVGSIAATTTEDGHLFIRNEWIGKSIKIVQYDSVRGLSSPEQTIDLTTVPEKPAAPASSKFKTTQPDSATAKGLIECLPVTEPDVTVNYEYSLDNGRTWTALASGQNITDIPQGTDVLIRFPAVVEPVTLASQVLVIHINTYTPPTPYNPGGGATTTKVPVIVDGVEYNIGTAQTSGGVTTVTVDQAALQKQLDAAKETVVVPITPGRNASTVVAQFVVANVDEMAEKEMTLSVQVDNVSYDMRAVAIDTEALMAELGATDPTKVPVNVTIAELANSAVTLESGTLVLSPVSFTVNATYGGKTTEVEVFEKYIQRVIEVPGAVDAGRITTAVVVENGSQRHVPTNVYQSGGKWYAQINSLTNSTYALINYEASFTDADGKWFESVVTEMASRGVINGRGEGIFDGDANITRAEFAAILVRALGLPETGDASAFTDVAKTAWYYGAVGRAYEYGLVGGRGNGIFDPTANITRQEAMAMVHRAAAITEFAGTTGTLAAFSDADSIGAWALADAQWNVGSGLIQGNNAGMICGQDNITRGETATIILRLLQKSELVDVRTKA